jgi:hypothetical protein
VNPVGLQCVTWLVKEKGAPLDGAGVGAGDDTLLQTAAQDGCAVLVQHLLDLGADANALPSGVQAEDEGSITANATETALTIAARQDVPDMVEVLLRAGADPNLEARVGKHSTLFHVLAIGFWPRARLLMQHGGRLVPSDHCECQDSYQPPL